MNDTTTQLQHMAKLRTKVTGEKYRAALERLLRTWEPGQPVIPAASTVEQARLECTVLHRGRGLSTVSAHPMGIRSLHPEGDLLTITLEPEPYAISHWAQGLLPVDPGPDYLVHGAGGLRYTTTSHHVLLTQLGTGAAVKLTGFPVHWWERAAAAVAEQALAREEHPCFRSPDICLAERDVEQWRAARRLDPYFSSALLRRINVTAFPGGYGGSDLWSDPMRPGWRWKLEMTNSPDHSRILKLLTHPLVGLDVTVTGRWCHCSEPDTGFSDRSGCTMKLASADGLCELEVRDLRWTSGRKAQERAAGNRAEENALAFQVYA
ncbi:hypothetical protein [Kitasatospora sp. NBC_01300]|uniref:hypothetical protein n=1 Tax=Kitasatospora sp. NBC_01300 TaxID=2903574 RepID=UPI002F90B42E|nr:hypothetical protein OG556_40000 [Kitasatospora sp. NBC_01300]